MNRSLALGGGGHGVLEGDAALAVGQLLCGVAACLDHPRELPLVLSGEERDLADVVQVQANRVVHDVGFQPFVVVSGIRIRYCAGWHTMRRSRGRRMCSDLGSSADACLQDRMWGTFDSTRHVKRGESVVPRARRLPHVDCASVPLPGSSTVAAPAVDDRDAAVASTRRIGLFGGTFDPPHVGHLVTAVNVRHALDLDVVVLMVANVPWQKEGTPLDHAGRSTAWRWSRRRSPTCRAWRPGGWRSISAGRASRPTRWPRWPSGSRASSCSRSSATTRRPGSPRGSATARSSSAPGWSSSTGPARRSSWPATSPWIHVEVPRLEVSSTDLRARFVDGRPLDYLVTDPVLQVIAERGLYGTRGVTALAGRRRRATLVVGIATVAVLVDRRRAHGARRRHALQLDGGRRPRRRRAGADVPGHADRRHRRASTARGTWRRSPCSSCSRRARAAASSPCRSAPTPVGAPAPIGSRSPRPSPCRARTRWRASSRSRRGCSSTRSRSSTRRGSPTLLEPVGEITVDLPSDVTDASGDDRRRGRRGDDRRRAGRGDPDGARSRRAGGAPVRGRRRGLVGRRRGDRRRTRRRWKRERTPVRRRPSAASTTSSDACSAGGSGTGRCGRRRRPTADNPRGVDVVELDPVELTLVFGQIAPAAVAAPNAGLTFRVVSSFSDEQLAASGRTNTDVAYAAIAALQFVGANVAVGDDVGRGTGRALAHRGRRSVARARHRSGRRAVRRARRHRRRAADRRCRRRADARHRVPRPPGERCVAALDGAGADLCPDVGPADELGDHR